MVDTFMVNTVTSVVHSVHIKFITRLSQEAPGNRFALNRERADPTLKIADPCFSTLHTINVCAAYYFFLL